MKFQIPNYKLQINRNCQNCFKFLVIGVSIIVCCLVLGAWDFAHASTNIDSTNRYAWNDVIGWIDFYTTGNVNVVPAQLTGYAYSSSSYIALDCATSPNGNICGTSNFKVSNDGVGNLTGWAWNDAIGWISFDNVTAGSPYPYQVTVGVSTGDFSGWAWNDVVGWISFNCANTSTCGTSNYKVNSSWRAVPINGSLDSSVFDTQVLGGTAFNSIMWQGYKPAGTSVKFQIATDSTSTPATWNYLGPDGSSATYYEPSDVGIPVLLNLAYSNNKRYLRYRIYLQSDISQTVTPRVDNVIINWSP